MIEKDLRDAIRSYLQSIDSSEYERLSESVSDLADLMATPGEREAITSAQTESV